MAGGARLLKRLARKKPRTPTKKVNEAKRKYAAIEQAAFEQDITSGAELRRVENLLEVANTMPI